MIRQQNGPSDEAIEYLKQVLCLSPGNVSVLEELGLSVAKRGYIDEGFQLLRTAWLIKPNNYDAVLSIVTFLIVYERFDEALFYFQILNTLNKYKINEYSRIEEIMAMYVANFPNEIEKEKMMN